MAKNKIHVEVAYAAIDRQQIIALEIDSDATIATIIQQSGILNEFPEIDLSQQKVGVFSKQRDLDETVEAGDRIEIYRPLTIDPKEARRAKAKKARRR